MRELFGSTTLIRFVLCWLAATLGIHSAEFQVIWGDVHGHTGFSDGKGSLDDYFIHARDVAKLDFVIVTDHDFGNAAPWRMPKEHWTLTQDKADEYTLNGRFVAIAGYEWTSQPKYWTDVDKDIKSERLFPGPPRFFNHKNVYFPGRVDYLFSSRDVAYNTPDLLADAVRQHGGLIHNNHPHPKPDAREQFAYTSSNAAIVVNTEMFPDVIRYKDKIHEMKCEQTVRAFLNRGGRTGFVGATDTHKSKPAARTAVLVSELNRAAIFDALGHRRNYAITKARIILNFQINGHVMGKEIEVEGDPQIMVHVQGTDRIEEVEVIRDGVVQYSLKPGKRTARFKHKDLSFHGKGYYYVRVTQADLDEHGNPSRAWSSPIWVTQKRATPMP